MNIVLLANTAMDTDKIKVFGSRVRTNDIKSLAEIEQAEKARHSQLFYFFIATVNFIFLIFLKCRFFFRILATPIKDKMKEKVEKICKYDMNVFVNRQLIYNYPEQVNTVSTIQ